MHSMTGFGRAEHATSTLAARVEAASVNRKQGEIVVQMPRSYAELEAPIRKLALKKLSRGRVSISIQIEEPEGTTGAVQLNTARATALEAAFTELSDALNRPVHPTATDFLRAPDVFDFNDQPAAPADAKRTIFPAVEKALDQMIAMRATEGKHLLDDIESRVSTLETISEKIITHAPSVKEKYKENLHRRLNEAGLEINLNDERVLKEIAIFADRSDISEELTRLNSHFEQFREFLASDEATGRKMDFLCQEIHREFNTTGSKSSPIDITRAVIDGKNALERIREQVQNIE